MKETIFITGATGNIGAKLVVRLLETDSNRQLILLIRGSSPAKALEKLLNALSIIEPDLPESSIRRIAVVCGDITRERFGLCEWEYNALATGVTHIIHSAAITKFTVPLPEAREVNVSGTATVMRFAHRVRRFGTLKGVAHLSTSFVCGRKNGVFSEDDPGDGRDFANSYEQTKWEAEYLVRGLMSELPITIFRPSIVVGDSQSGRTIHFNVLYTPLRYIMAGQVRGLPCSPRALLDVVAVDYVVDAIRYIFLTGRCSGTTYHLVASRRTSCTVDEIVSHALSHATRKVSRNDTQVVQYLNREEYESRSKGCRGREKLMCEMLRAFEPYINSQVVFSDTNTAAALDGTGISPPPVIDYLDSLLDYCFLCNWGRRLNKAA